MSGIALTRLAEERKQWRQNHPFGFVARPYKMTDGSFCLWAWECVIPGLKNTIWEHGMYSLLMEFPDNYPESAPYCKFVPPLFHPNIFPSGSVWLPILDNYKDWNGSKSIREILQEIQFFLAEPDIRIMPANELAYITYKYDLRSYNKKVREQAKAMSQLRQV